LKGSFRPHKGEEEDRDQTCAGAMDVESEAWRMRFGNRMDRSIDEWSVSAADEWAGDLNYVLPSIHQGVTEHNYVERL
jgi:hypothetical protein